MGLLHLEYQLSNDTVEGNWTIEINNKQKKIIQVQKHILPRFKVDVEYPKSFYVKSKEALLFKICAK